MATATLTWTLPTTRTDGTPLAPSDIKQTVIFDDFVSPTNPISIVPAPGTTVTVNADPGTHNFTATVQDQSGNQSAHSNVATAVVPSTAPPAAITDLAVTVH